MKYDPRIKNEHCIRDPFNVETAKQYIGKRGYFTDDIFNFSNLDSCCAGMLAHVEADSRHPYYCAISDEGVIIKGNFSFFLSAEFVEEKPKEKKYRPYTLEEFLNDGFEVLNEGLEIVIFREKGNPLTEYHVRYNGYRKYDNNVYKVILGNISYTLSDLFEDFERFYNGRWFPFGVKEE